MKFTLFGYCAYINCMILVPFESSRWADSNATFKDDFLAIFVELNFQMTKVARKRGNQEQ